MILHRHWRALALCLLIIAGCGVGADAQVTSLFVMAPAWQGPPLALAEALQLALDANPELLSAQANAAPLAERPAQARSLEPPRLEAQIWQWPVTTIDPGRVDMYMFMIEQDLPGRGKRELRAAAAREGARDSSRGRGRAAARDPRRGPARVCDALRSPRATSLPPTRRAGRSRGWSTRPRRSYAAGGGSQQSVVKALLEASRVQERMTSCRRGTAGAARLNSLMGRAADTPIGALDEPRPEPPRAARALARPTRSHATRRFARARVQPSNRRSRPWPSRRRNAARLDGAGRLHAHAGRGRSVDGARRHDLAHGALGQDTAGRSDRRSRQTSRCGGRQASRPPNPACARWSPRQPRAWTPRARASRCCAARSCRRPEHLSTPRGSPSRTRKVSLSDALEARLLLLEAQLDEARAIREAALARTDLDTAIGDDARAESAGGLTLTRER